MPWIVGIDEAGYGPNLGPFVMTAVTYRLAPQLAKKDLWGILAAAVRRPYEMADERLLIEDSKVVYSPARGLVDLESSVLATQRCPVGSRYSAIRHFLTDLCSKSLPHLAREVWFKGTLNLPVEADENLIENASRRFYQTCEDRDIAWGRPQSVVVCPGQFNRLVERCGSKGAVLAHSLQELLGQFLSPDETDEPVHFFVDKHGGRNFYAAIIQESLGAGMVVAREEGPDRSIYSILGMNRDIRLTFQPRADAVHFCVALASMISKYLRELFMREFNDFWESHVPGLRPTAGYPGDADRYYQAIRPAVERLKIAEAAVWRQR